MMHKFLKIITFSTALTLVSPAMASDKFWQTYADIGAIGIPAAAGAITLARDDRPGLLQLGLTGGSSLLVTTALKHGIDSTRPNGGDHSFPSGHSAIAAGFAAALAWKYPRGRIYFIVFAVMAASQRIVSLAHFPSDACFGAALGLIGASFFLRRQPCQPATLPPPG
jgi:membrane-associated phospholipid phosphatase